METFVNVGIRIRPLFGNSTSTIKLISKNPWLLQVDDKFEYKADRIFDENTSQEEIYNEIVKPLVKKVYLGYNCTVFAYGQTGTGKTYTMGSNTEAYEENGFILRSINDFLEYVDKDTEIFMSFFEIYNEKIYDLLETNKKYIPIKSSQDIPKQQLFNISQVKSVLKKGSSNRHTGETKQNKNSSRSHAILTLHYISLKNGVETSGKLNLVDLAGFESVKKTGSIGHQFQEGVNINKGLLSIGRVISALAGNEAHIPFRESKITTILQDSLNKNNYVTLIACISPDQEDIRETIQTLEFTQETKKIKYKPHFSNLFSTQKKQSLNKVPLKRHIPQNLFAISNKKIKLIDMACSPIKPFKILQQKEEDFSPTKNSFTEFEDGNNFGDLSPVIEKCVEKELFKLYANSENSLQISADNLVAKTEKEVLQSTLINENKNISPDNKENTMNSIYSSTPANSLSLRKFITDTIRREIKKIIDTNNCTDSTICLTKSPANFKFKIPSIPSKYKCKANLSNFKPRRSKRISVKNNNNESDVSWKINGDEISTNPDASQELETFKPRRSMRLNSKKSVNYAHLLRGSPKKNKINNTVKNKKNKTDSCSNCQKRKRDYLNGDMSPRSSHKNYVLNLLNNGSETDLQKLVLVGPKTASKIYLFRSINGKFTDLQDLNKMTDLWTKKGFSRFLKENFLE